MKCSRFNLVSVLFLVITTNAFSQNDWAVEFRPNLDFPTKDIGEIEPKTGFGFEVAVSYSFTEHLGAYVGWGYNTFKTTSNLTEFDNDVDMTGYSFGLQFFHPFSDESKFSYVIRAGGIYNHLEFEDKDGNIFEDTGHGLGYEFGVGIDYTFLETWHVRPQIGYRALSRDIEFGDIKSDVDLNYISFGVGILKTF
ncbi:outer membrane beta-barrel protein [Winogradskyella algicola]|uniref:outer membrane beta-barrel protein n=1 Tax=Winogradskyella algicola TaxID=2575815 RepID=UPI001FE389F1|nr:outer membrane beta-barrel protein [Winogradskyella algicola]